MRTITINELNAQMAKPGARVVIGGRTDRTNKTRDGIYIGVTVGLVSNSYFVGHDLVNETDIVEMVG